MTKEQLIELTKEMKALGIEWFHVKVDGENIKYVELQFKNNSITKVPDYSSNLLNKALQNVVDKETETEDEILYHSAG